MDKNELAMIYPTFQIIEDRGIIPRVYLPRDYKERVKRFYEQKRQEEIAQYVNELEKMLAQESIVKVNPDIKLQWDDTNGLINISIGYPGGFDLIDNGCAHFQEHNLSTKSALTAACIATKYVSELLKT
jgi:hypothetical protein